MSLFVPAILKPEIPEHVAATNLDFLAKYRGLYMEPLSTPPVVPNEAEVQSGDMFGGIRYCTPEVKLSHRCSNFPSCRQASKVAGSSVTFGDRWFGSFLHSVTSVTSNSQQNK